MKLIRNHTLSFLLSFSLVFSLTACTKPAAPAQEPEPASTVVDFTDSLGRTVQVPSGIKRVAVSGPLAQIPVFSIASDLLVGTADAWSADAGQYLDTAAYQLPELGQLYGGKGELNMETLLAAAPDVVIDIGEPKGTMAADLDSLSVQTGIPFVHIDAYLDTLDETYTMLGTLLGREEQAATLAAYCRKVQNRTLSLMEKVGDNKCRVVYSVGETGTNVICQSSYHAEVLDLLTDNAAVSESPSSKGTGNEVSLEELYNWDPEVILFAPDGYYDSVASDSAWQALKAVKNGRYYEVPSAIYNWMGFPPSVQRLAGMQWLSYLLYPDYCEHDLYTEIAEFYDLFFHVSLTPEQFAHITENSLAS